MGSNFAWLALDHNGKLDILTQHYTGSISLYNISKLRLNEVLFYLTGSNHLLHVSGCKSLATTFLLATSNAGLAANVHLFLLVRVCAWTDINLHLCQQLLSNPVPRPSWQVCKQDQILQTLLRGWQSLVQVQHSQGSQYLLPR